MHLCRQTTVGVQGENVFSVCVPCTSTNSQIFCILYTQINMHKKCTCSRLSRHFSEPQWREKKRGDSAWWIRVGVSGKRGKQKDRKETEADEVSRDDDRKGITIKCVKWWGILRRGGMNKLKRQHRDMCRKWKMEKEKEWRAERTQETGKTEKRREGDKVD